MGLLNNLKDKITRYVDVHLNLAKLSFIKRTSGVLSYFIFTMIALFIVFCILIFLGFGIVEAFVATGMSRVLAFFVTFAVYIVLLVVVISLRKNITGFFAGGIISAMTDDDDDEEEADKKETGR